uniref:Uncharacterized protein n=1 Tax=Tetraselmis chuii TaxID=63592 RepID=A0A6U1KQ41_9CHLO|mmetsp:Transcript_5996/g.10820  ORF Transcript_5996/g.10820 Transcript_5996/m.10820 type:complete len:296 (+) Transcript_5996:269-1156(+)
MERHGSSDDLPVSELSAASAERLLVSGDAERAATVAEMVLRSGRRRPLARNELDAALAVLLQAHWKLGSFGNLEPLLTELVGGVQELPIASLLLWASIGCEAGEVERVGAALQLRLRLVSSGKQSLSAEDLTATVRMYSLEVLGKEGGDPLGAKEWAKQWHTGMGDAEYKKLLQDLEALAVSGASPKPSTPEIQESEALAEGERPGGAEAGAAADENRGAGGGGKDGGSCESWRSWGRQLLTDAHEALPVGLREMEPHQLAAGAVACGAVAFALYVERKQIYGRLRRARVALFGA